MDGVGRRRMHCEIRGRFGRIRKFVDEHILKIQRDLKVRSLIFKLSP